jgi:nickel/cobalt transporter (NiCoT) family protein
LLQKPRRSIGVGFFFSLGHSTIVVVTAFAAALAAATLKRELPAMQQVGSIVGMTISATFLWLVALLNLGLLRDCIARWRAIRSQHHREAHHYYSLIEEVPAPLGLFNRLFGHRWQGAIRHSWQMFPVGMLFGLGFDTASEIALIAMATASGSTLPLPAMLSLPLLFAAGMVLLDTTDGVLMVQLYSWALIDPLRKLSYNMMLTCLSVAAALAIGTAEGLQVLAQVLELHERPFAVLHSLDSGFIGILIIVLLLAAWVLSALIWKLRRHRADAVTSPLPLNSSDFPVSPS